MTNGLHCTGSIDELESFTATECTTGDVQCEHGIRDTEQIERFKLCHLEMCVSDHQGMRM